MFNALLALPMLMAIYSTLPKIAHKTFCNPINVDYGFCPIPNFSEQGKHRATADPAIVMYMGDYYMFSTNQWGYWWSHDMFDWKFVPRKFLHPGANVFDELCAPAIWIQDGALHVIGSTYTKDFAIWKSTNPKKDEWHQAIEHFPVPAWDPAFYLDDDGRLYLYHGSSNTFPTYGQEIDPKTFQPIGDRVELLRLHDDLHGWERFGENNDNTFLRPFIEGSWMTKHNGKYYLQYGAPGTEFSGYADGVYVSEHPLGPFEYQLHNPLSMKAGGFARGAGHGATYQDRFDNWWHVSTITIAVKNNFERRIGIWPAGFDKAGVMYTNCSYGDYPTLLPATANQDHIKGEFAGWMLLNYAKPVQASSTLGAFSPNFAVDESMKSYWSAATSRKGEWFQSDLGAVSSVHAIQVNYADQDATVMGKVPGLYHQYRILGSTDGRTWELMVDKSTNTTDVPHDYIEFAEPIRARFVKIENIHMATGKFALSGFRVFGKGEIARPKPVKNFVVLRADNVSGADRRSAWLKWQVSDDATGYVIYSGVAPDKLYTSTMVYGANEYYFNAMSRDVPYYFQIEAFNEGGLSERSTVHLAN